jgi:branched-chain amino acid transport system permease protein
MQVLTILLDGISYGMVLFIISVGLTVTMGLMRVVNLAHGAFAMIGGYIATVLVLQAGVPFLLSALLAAVVAGMLGGLAELTVYRPLYRKGELPQVLLTIGLCFVVIAGLTLFVGPTPLPAIVPGWLDRMVDIGFRSYPAYRLFLIAVGAVLAFIVWLIVERSLFGARLRAAVDDPQMARAVGMNVSRMFTVTFIGGCALAGFGGAIGAGVLPLEPFYALRYLVYFLIVVAVGGMGSFRGSLVAALAIGIVDTAGRYIVPQFGGFLLYVLVFGLLLWRPNGLLPPKSVA